MPTLRSPWDGSAWRAQRMPLTPLHLGPGAAFKGVAGRSFSFMVFGGAQVLMDIEPLMAMIRGWPVLHGVSHTVAGALVVGLVAGAVGRPVSTWVLERAKIPHFPITWRASFAGAFVGTCSHVMLDALMHADMRPWWPIGMTNPLLGAVSIDALHGLCMGAGVLGAALITWRYHRAGRV
ncbi:MAG: hypothetical protein PHP86_06770 [Nevskiales bacterium]|nr:hypothetical protein [Nevskiales bacterium]